MTQSGMARAGDGVSRRCQDFGGEGQLCRAREGLQIHGATTGLSVYIFERTWPGKGYHRNFGGLGGPVWEPVGSTVEESGVVRHTSLRQTLEIYISRAGGGFFSG